MRLPVRHWPDPVLLTPTKQWTWGSNRETLLEKCLIDTMIAEGGIGLAANQVGEPWRVMAIKTSDGKIIVMYNPTIVAADDETEVGNEGCLSFPKIELQIPRKKHVTVTWMDSNQSNHISDFRGIDARCIQHEIDHLDGKVFKDYVSNLKFQRAQQQSKK